MSGVVADVSRVPGEMPIQDRSISPSRGLHNAAEVRPRDTLPAEGTELRQITDRMSRQFKNSTQRYISDIFRLPNKEEATKFCSVIRNDAMRYNSRRFLIICQHDKHVHVVHLCTFSGSHCRCSFIEKAKAQSDFRKPYSGVRRKYANRIDTQDCANILFYFGGQQREQNYKFFIIDGRVERELCRNKIFQEQGHLYDSARTEQHQVEACNQNDQVELLSPEQRREGSSEDRTARFQRSIKPTSSRKKSFQDRILLMCKKYCMSPIKDIYNHIEWLLDEELQFVRPDNRLSQSVIDSFSNYLCHYTLEDLYKMYTAPNANPCFIATNNKPFSIYYDVEDSVFKLNELLLWQFHNDPDLVYLFLLDLYNVVDRKLSKCNSILVYSPPSAGKNWFFDTVLAFCMNKGQMGNPNKHNTFAYQECVGKRILLWNEPNYESSQLDMLKMILGGDNYTVNVKCKADQAVAKTPVIILTNTRVGIMYEAAFRDRIKQYHWRAAPYLKEYKKKPYPIAFYLLLKQYNIVLYKSFNILIIHLK
nr:NS1 [Mute swan feces associated ambidensovirus 6]